MSTFAQIICSVIRSLCFSSISWCVYIIEFVLPSQSTEVQDEDLPFVTPNDDTQTINLQTRWPTIYVTVFDGKKVTEMRKKKKTRKLSEKLWNEKV